MTRTLLALSLLALGPGLLTGTARGQATVYEGFDYAPTGDTTGLNGGRGFAGGWESTTSFWGVSSPGSTFGILTAAGNRATSIRRSGISRPLDSALLDAGLLDDGATLWFSAIVDITTGGPVNSNLALALTNSIGFPAPAANPEWHFLDDDGITSDEGIGFAYRAVGEIGGAYWQDDDAGADAYSERVLSDDRILGLGTQLIVGKIEWGVHGAADETLSLYAPDPGLDLGPAVLADWPIPPLDQGSFDRIAITGKDTPSLDEIRFGATSADVLPTEVAPGVEQFDTYSAGPLAAQSLWQEWAGSSGVDATVVDSPHLTPDRALSITGQPADGSDGDHVIYDYASLPLGRPTSGTYILTASSFVPGGATGEGQLLALNQYPSPVNFSLRQSLDAGLGQFVPLEPAGTSTPLLHDQWVPVITCIDLDGDRVDVFYGEELVVENGAWIGDGLAEIACLALHGGEPTSNGITEMLFDNVRLERTGPGMGLVSSPSPVTDGGNVRIQLGAPQARSGRGFLYIWEVNGIPFRKRLLNVNLDASGEWSFSGSIPSGLGGLQIGLKAFAIPPGGGKVNESNLDLLVVR